MIYAKKVKNKKSKKMSVSKLMHLLIAQEMIPTRVLATIVCSVRSHPSTTDKTPI